MKFLPQVLATADVDIKAKEIGSIISSYIDNFLPLGNDVTYKHYSIFDQLSVKKYKKWLYFTEFFECSFPRY